MNKFTSYEENNNGLSLSDLTKELCKLKLLGLTKKEIEKQVTNVQDGKAFWKSFKTRNGEYFGFILMPVGGLDCHIVFTDGLSCIACSSSTSEMHNSSPSLVEIYTKNKKRAYCVVFDEQTTKLTVYYWDDKIPTEIEEE